MGCKVALQWPAFTFHLAVVLIYIGGDYYRRNFIVIPEDGEYAIYHEHGGCGNMLTIWFLTFQPAYFLLCLLNDVTGANEAEPAERTILRKMRDFLHATIGVPLSLTICVLFWSMYLIDPHRGLEEHVPMLFTICAHSLIFIFSLGEIWLTHCEYPSRRVGLGVAPTVFIFYCCWLTRLYLITNAWIYPILNIATWPQRIAIFIVGTFCTIISYLIGESLTSIVWGSPGTSMNFVPEKNGIKNLKYMKIKPRYVMYTHYFVAFKVDYLLMKIFSYNIKQSGQ